MDIDQVIPTFLIEAHELLEQYEQGLLQIENGEADEDTLNAIFRAAHTIKGSAGVFAFNEIVSFTHTLESVLDRLREHELGIDRALTELLLACGDHLAALVQRGEERDASANPALHAQGEQLHQRLSHYLNAEASAPAPLATDGADTATTPHWHLSLRFAPDTLHHGMDPLSIISYLSSLGEIVGIALLDQTLPPLAELDAECCYLGFELALASSASYEEIDATFDFVRDDATIHLLPPHSPLAAYTELGRTDDCRQQLGLALQHCGTLSAAEWAQAAPAPQPEAASLPVPLSAPAICNISDAGSKNRDSGRQKVLRVDADKLDQLIDLVGELVIASAGANLVAGELGVARMQEATSTMARLIEEVRDSTLNLRMVQIGDTFNRFQRVVRDVARDLGKDIRLHIGGAETELDKTVVEKIGDPLLHLIRNAMDHGIEPAAVREAKGKPAAGTIQLNAYHDAGSVVIEVGDDGGGLNRERILSKARDKGLVGPQQTLSDAEICQLIFAPGFSTAEQLSNISGRGVGMDVVKKNIEALHGTIEIDSVPGTGTTMRIRLPLTLAIIDGFLVRVGSSDFVIPLDQVVECIELTDADRHAAGAQEYVNQRGQILPYTRLSQALELPAEQGSQPDIENLVVVQYGGKRAGLVVDELRGEIQTVIKPLGRIFNRVQGISGSTILGSGAIALILDIPRLLQQVADRPSDAARVAGHC